MALAFVSDSLGRTWIGKGDGLCCNYGKFHLVYSGQGDGQRLPDSHIRDLCIGEDGKLWIGDNSGLRYMEDGSFITPCQEISSVVMRVVPYPDGGVVFTSLGGVFRYTSRGELLKSGLFDLTFTSSLAVSPSGEIWSATQYRELNRIHVLSPSLEEVKDIPLPLNVDVLDLSVTPEGDVWVSTDDGVMVFSGSTYESIEVPDAVRSITEGERVLFARPSFGTMLLGIRGKGIHAYLASTGKTYHVFQEENLDAWTYTVYISPQGRIWLSDEKGPSKSYWAIEDFPNLFPAIQPDYHSFSNEMAADSRGNLWIARGEWLLGYDPLRDTVFQKIRSKTGFISATVDDSDRLWTMVGRGEISMYEIKEGNASFVDHRKLNNDSIRSLDTDPDGNVWVFLESGIKVLPSGIRQEITLPPLAGGLATVIRDSGSGELYALSFTRDVYRCRDSLMLLGSLPENLGSVTSVCTLQDGKVLIGTSRDGVHVKEDGWEFRKDERYPSGEIRGIASDRNGIIWIATKNNIHKFEPSNGHFTTFFSSGFSAARPYSRGSGVMGSDGNLYFCGEGGVTKVDVTRELQPLSEAVTLIDYVSVNGTPMTPVPSSLRLSRKENNIRFLFSPVGGSSLGNLSYSYRLKGLDKEWIYTVGPEVSYTSLRPGKYTFMVRSGNNGDWGKELSFPVVIKPHPLWSNLSKLIYLVLLLVAAMYLMHLYTQMKVQKQKAEDAEEREKMKQDEIDYLTNVAHELRNPLTMIYGPLNQLSQDSDVPEKDRNLIKASANAASRLREITDEILDISRPSADKEALKVSESDIFRYISGISEGFRYAFKDKKITFTANIPEGLHGWVDTDKFYKILANLLSNAVKYTPEGGNVELNVAAPADDGILRVSVSDDGPGIPNDKRDAIFGRFERLESDVQGSGIGLHYSRMLARLHKGDITLSESAAEGSCFTFSVPVSEAAYSSEEKVPNVFETGFFSVEKDDVHKMNPSKKTIYLVEDNPEIRSYLDYLFHEAYNVYAEPDAESAMENMKVVVPDIIVSDYIMPGMDGMAFCKALKDNPEYRLIPFVLLTGKSDSMTHARGLEGGADSFIPKPFDPSVLKATVESLLRAREQFQSKVLSMDTDGAPSEDDEDIQTISERDRSFLSKLASEVGENISNAGFTIDELSKKMFMSYSSLYASTKTLTGLTPQAYLVRRRMEAAKDLVLGGKHSMTEISEMVGYGSLSHFSREFKKYFGENPSSFSESGMNRDHAKSVQ